MNKLILIAAIGKNNELGYKNKLIWHIKEDMKFFKECTMGHYLLMGKNTFDSLPNLLKGRTHMVLSRKSKSNFPKEVIVLNSIEEFDMIKNNINDDVYVIGGALVYEQMIDKADMMYLTEIDSEFLKADAFFPTFNKDKWKRVVLNEYKDFSPSYKHVLYKKIK